MIKNLNANNTIIKPKKRVKFKNKERQKPSLLIKDQCCIVKKKTKNPIDIRSIIKFKNERRNNVIVDIVVKFDCLVFYCTYLSSCESALPFVIDKKFYFIKERRTSLLNISFRFFFLVKSFDIMNKIKFWAVT